MLEWRLKAYRHWLTMPTPDWAKLNVPPIDYQDAYYWAAPKKKDGPKSLDEVDPEILRVYEKLGIPLEEQKVLAGVEGARKIAVDAVFDSVSVATTFRKELEEAGVIFRSISEAIREYPDLVKRGWARSCRCTTTTSPRSTARSFRRHLRLHPEGVRCPMELSTYFRINAENTGQFERTLIVADKGAYVSYLEGCTAPMRDENQLHAAVVELVALDDAEIKYSTVQNWYPGDARARAASTTSSPSALCQGARSKVSWTQVETGSAITWKYPSCVLNGEDGGRVLLGRRHQQLPAGRYRHQDDPQRQGRARPSCPRASAPAGRTTPIAAWCAWPQAEACATSPSATRCCSAGMRRAYRALYRGAQPRRHDRARGDHQQDLRRPAVLRCSAGWTRKRRGADRQRLRKRGAAATADGIRGGSAEAAGHQPGRSSRLKKTLTLKPVEERADAPKLRKGRGWNIADRGSIRCMTPRARCAGRPPRRRPRWRRSWPRPTSGGTASSAMR
jgi:hypothetical protein